MTSIRLIAPSWDFAYQAKHPLDLAEVLASRGFRVEVVAPMSLHVKAIHANRGFRITRVPSLLPSLIPWAKGRGILIHSLLRSLRPADITIGVDTPGFLVAHVLRRLRLTKVLVYYTMHVSVPEDCPGQETVWYQTRYVNDSDLVITTGPHRAAIMRERFRLKSLPFILRNTLVLGGPPMRGALREALHARHMPVPDHLVVYVGFMGERIGLVNIVESMASWPSNAGLVLLGQGSADFVDRLLGVARRGGFADRLIYFGPVPPGREIMSSLIASASIGIVTRKYKNGTVTEETYDPGKLLEYAAVGVPVLCSDQPSLEFVQQEGWGVCVDPESPTQIGTAVSHMLSDPKGLDAMGKTARRLFEERYCMERQVQPILDALSL